MAHAGEQHPAERAVCNTRCPVVMKVTTGGESWSWTSGRAIADRLLPARLAHPYSATLDHRRHAADPGATRCEALTIRQRRCADSISVNVMASAAAFAPAHIPVSPVSRL